MPRYAPRTTAAGASARELADVLDPHGCSDVAWRVERFEELLAGMSRRSRVVLLNALLKSELDAARAAKAGRQT